MSKPQKIIIRDDIETSGLKKKNLHVHILFVWTFNYPSKLDCFC